VTRSSLVLLPSPLLGPAVWVPVAGVLRDGGWTAVLPEALTSAPHEPEDVLRWWLKLPLDGSVLVVHSNAGLYVPTLVARHDVRGVVFVDAGYPELGVRSVPMAPPVVLDFLRGLADDAGLLPPWTRWWPETDSLFPDEASRQAVTAEQQRLPVEYFAAQLAVPESWAEGLPVGYLAFGNTYDGERQDAERRGWPTRVMAGRHLHMLVDPTGVSAAIEELVTSAGPDVGDR
jgi:hypothetical protein